MSSDGVFTKLTGYMRTMRKCYPLFAGFVLTLVGAIFLIVGLSISSSMSGSDYLPAEGVISSFSKPRGEAGIRSTYIDYYADGVLYNHVELTSFSSAWEVGDRLRISYNKNDPSDIRNKGLELMPLIFAAVGAVMLLIGVFVLVRRIEAFSRRIRDGGGDDDNGYTRE